MVRIPCFFIKRSYPSIASDSPPFDAAMQLERRYGRSNASHCLKKIKRVVEIYHSCFLILSLANRRRRFGFLRWMDRMFSCIMSYLSVEGGAKSQMPYAKSAFDFLLVTICLKANKNYPVFPEKVLDYRRAVYCL